ncbi:unnamed protein product [Thlaspi arvense]|uniref:Disease resistance RPP13-like protein 1 n=1 Tax=Thlaspi arvense TaxID=13288 RepID=A0AAU9T7N2_THLAR|nr:unnamed protein product [Thlaspi arvense]
MAIFEIFLSAFFSTLFKKMASRELWDFVCQEGIEDQFEQWKKTLSKIQAVLADAEKKQIVSKVVTSWLEDLQDLAYDLDDLVDDFATEVLKRKLMAGTQASTSKAWNFIPTCCTNYEPSTVLFNAQMKSKIDAITSRLNNSFNQSSGLNLETIVETTSVQGAWRRPETTSLLNEPQIYGREQEKKRIIELLLEDNPSQSKFGVIPLVGMGGVGKTTLAQLVFNDEKVKEHFDMKAWVCVSDEFDIMRITKVILESVTSRKCEFTSLDKVQEQLINSFKGKKFLIVLDDIWNKNLGNWMALKSPFNHGAQGSKVLVTTRNKDIAMMMGTVKDLGVGLLSDADCWSLLEQHAFGNRSMDANPKLESIGREIAKKCGGLPLAARTIGGLLRCKEREDEWEVVLHSNIWNLSKDENDIVPALRLSFHYLPPHLKQCFAYCAILPKDYEFEENELILLWMAEGFIQQETGQQMEEVGAGHFQELVFRSFFLPSNSTILKFVMHDLINDLAYEVGKNSCFRLEDVLRNGEQHGSLMKARHASYMQGYKDGMDKFETFHKAKNLRTFLPFSLKNGTCYLTRSVTFDLLPKLSYLRELSLRNYAVEEIPSSIGNLKHLRYIDLSYSCIKSLPDSFGNLYNLQTLNLQGCSCLMKISFDMGNLANLRHLYFPPLEEMPLGIGKLTSLQILSSFFIRKGNGSRIKELGDLNHLRGTVCIFGLENIVDVEDARNAKLKNKLKLSKLSMLWNKTSSELRDQGVGAEMFDALRPPNNLRELDVEGYHGIRFPCWMGDPEFSRLVTVSLGFSKLQELSFVDMLEWEDWQTTEAVKKVQPFSHVIEVSKLNYPSLASVSMKEVPFPILSIDEMGKDLGHSSLASLDIGGFPIPNYFSNPGRDDEIIKEYENDGQEQQQLEVLPRLELLSIETCDKLDKLPQGLQNFMSLRDLIIHGCYNLVNFPEHGFPCTLRRLKIKQCDALRWLPIWNVQDSNLEELVVEFCVSLEYLIPSSGGLPLTLKHLSIWNCEKMFALLEEEEGLVNLPCIESFKISTCMSLKFLPDANLHNSGSNNLNRLTELYISNCGNLEHISQAWFTLPTNLTNLEISDCEKLLQKDLFSNMSLTCLKLLRIEGGFEVSCLRKKVNSFSNLTELHMGMMTTWMPPSEWGLDRLSSLEVLDLYGPIVIVESESKHMEVDKKWSSFPFHGMLLPASLTNLDIGMETEFKVEVEASGKVRDKNLVDLTGGVGKVAL